ncbi:PIR Superfamily Protein [Plasmodium ovale wallikeri]|uniref:PIR Superfamily Protein n=1 Tax=Plasmodium ovale wallikeri TaxID=864142 RepID=A0A1A9AL29_PLAOA|nr:PIR Superfamily Protein [Plasmodium ovale wallikeri]SBT56931.1 PIR Superfamily Protein [Plasmodium ovale wallikeri]
MKTNCDEETELPSCNIYYELNTRNGDSFSSSDDCERIEGKFSYSGILEICQKLERNLANFGSSVKRSNPLKYNCEFIHYWLFGEILNNSSITDDSKLEGVMSQFYRTWENVVKSLNPEIKCESIGELFKSISINDLKFRKDMHDYIYNFDRFCEITFDNEQIDNRYCKYLPSMRDKYTQIIEKCPMNTNICFKRITAQRESEVDGSLEDGKRANYGHGETVTSVEESETSTILTTVGPSLLGLFMTSFILFKLTPIRSWLNNQILKNRKVEEYMDEQSSSELLNNYFIHEDTGSEENGYGIAYHSA